MATVKISPDNWDLLGRMYNSVAELKEKLENKGFTVIASLGIGIHPACLTFIVERNHAKVLSFCSLDIITEESRVGFELFEKAEAILETDLDALEREALLKRLEELNRPTNGKR